MAAITIYDDMRCKNDAVDVVVIMRIMRRGRGGLRNVDSHLANRIGASFKCPTSNLDVNDLIDF